MNKQTILRLEQTFDALQLRATGGAQYPAGCRPSSTAPFDNDSNYSNVAATTSGSGSGSGSTAPSSDAPVHVHAPGLSGCPLFERLYVPLLASCVAFLDARSCARLDSAVCSRTWRPFCLSSLRQGCRPPFEAHLHSQASLAYLVLRGMRGVTVLRLSRRGLCAEAEAESEPYGSGLFSPVQTDSASWEQLLLQGCPIRDCHLRSLARCCADGCDSGSSRRGSPVHTLDLYMCMDVTDAGVGELLRALQPGLLRLRLAVTNKRLVGDPSLFVLGSTPAAASLLQLQLAHCYSVTNMGVAAVAAACPMLQLLDLTWCNKVSDTALLALAAAACAGQLQDLSLSDCIKVTSRGLCALAPCCPQLRRLVLSCCLRVDDGGVIAVADSCPHLQELKLSGCTLVGDSAAAALASHCSLLRCCLLRGTAVGEGARQRLRSLPSMKAGGV